MIGDFKQIGITLFFIVLGGVILFYVLERFWISEKVEEANPENDPQDRRKTSCGRRSRSCQAS
jgi:hypothetical protein